MISIINYGLGNVQAFANIFHRLGLEYSVATCPEDLAGTSHLLLPGVGSFDWAMKRLEASGLRPVLDELVLNQQLPVLGICVGMQMMASSSEEGTLPGLGWIPGEVKRFDETLLSSKSYLPHMGWNDIFPGNHHYLLISTILDFTSCILIISGHPRTNLFLLRLNMAPILQLLSLGPTCSECSFIQKKATTGVPSCFKILLVSSIR